MRSLLFMLCLLLAGQAAAQNYSPIRPGVKRYFTNTEGYLRGIRADSTTIFGADTLYHLHRMVRGELQPMFMTMLDSNGAHWIGRPVRQGSDGTWWFGNFLNDTLVLKPAAGLNDSWTFYSDSSAVHYEATVTGLDTMTVLGILDSVKTIRLAALSGSSVVTGDSLHGLDIILSKHHGFVQVPDLFMFPYHRPNAAFSPHLDYFLTLIAGYAGAGKEKMLFRLTSYHTPSLTEIFNFQPGDVFEKGYYSTFYGAYNADSLDTVLTRTVTGPQVTYTMKRWHWYYAGTLPGLPVTIQEGTGSVTWDATLLFRDDLMPEEYPRSEAIYFLPADTSLCYVADVWKVEGWKLGGNKFYSGLVYPSYRHYKAGLGLIYFFGQSGDPNTEEGRMIYARKGNNGCGRFVAVPTGVDDALSAGSFSLYPNPARNELHVRLPDLPGPLSIILRDLTGRVRCSWPARRGRHFTLSLPHLAAGVYQVSLVTDGGRQVHRTVTIIP